MSLEGYEELVMPQIAPMKLQCDLVMRGGIASGLVYPRAIAKLAETYDFRSIGGLRWER